MAGTAASGTTVQAAGGINGGRFDFDDGGTYCGGWEEGKAHGHGVCTGPKGQGEYAGSWHYGFEVSGVYTWPSGSFYEGHWQNGKRHGLGVESRGKWLYRGEWTQGFKGRYGVRQSTTTLAKYEGTWANGLQDGYGSETYADGGTYQGQWLRGMRHGYGVRTSAAFGIASHSRGADGRRPSISSLQPGVEESKVVMTNGTRGGGSGGGEEARGGFVLKSRSDEAPVRRRSLVERTGMKNLMQGLRIRKQRSTGDLDRKGVIGSIRSTGSTTSWMSSESNYAGASIMSEGSQASFIVEDEMLDANVTETYMGEWKNDKRCGFGISERSDGLKYEGEWFNNRKYGYGVTTFKDGSREEGKYKNNILITSNKKKHLFLIRSAKFRERIDSAVSAAQRASKIALQKADIAISRTATARGKAEQADYAAVCAREDSTEARACAQTLAPEFGKPGDGIGVMGLGGLDKEMGGPGPPAIGRAAAPNTLELPPAPAQNKLSLGPPSPRGQGPGPPSPGGGGMLGPGPPSPRNPVPAQPQFLENKPTASMVGNHIGGGGGGGGIQQQPLQGNNVMKKTSVPNNPSLDVRSSGPPAPPPSHPAPPQAAPPQTRPASRQPPPPKTMSPQPSDPVRQNNNMTNMSDISSRVNNAAAAAAPPPPQQQLLAPPQHLTRLEPEPEPAFPDAAVLRQPATLQISEQVARGRTPTRGPHPQPPSQRASMAGPPPAAPAQHDFGGGGGSQAGGGYNFQKIMDDRFEHYKRPPSRERSADRFGGASSRAGSRQQLSRDVSRDRGLNTLNRPGSRQRTPAAVPDSLAGGVGDKNLDSLNLDAPQPTGNGAAIGGGLADLKLPADEQLRYRGVHQEIPHFGAPPKRTESLYMKAADNQEPTFKAIGGSAMQRKKSLPDVAALPTVSVKAGTQVMTREEISVLSSARRDQIRRDLEEAEKYRANPILYIFNPYIRDWFSRQQLMVLVLIVNITLAVMFFKLLT